MDAQLEPFFKLQKEMQYLSGCLIYFHYKVYMRVKKKKIEKEKKRKAKAAAAKKKKKKGSSIYSK